MLLQYKTNVRKHGGRWWVSYYMPYSGFLTVDFKSWKKAMREAWQIEKYKAES